MGLEIYRFVWRHLCSAPYSTIFNWECLVLLVWNRASGCHRTKEALSFSWVQRSLVLVESLIPPPSPLFPFKVLTDFATNLSKLSNLYPTFWPGLRFTNIRYHSFIFQQIFLIQIANWLQQTAEFQPWWILALCQDTLKFSFFNFQLAYPKI